MAKYSTGAGGGQGEGETCELCGAANANLEEATVAGATLLVCPDCAPHSDESSSRESKPNDQTTKDDSSAQIDRPSQSTRSELWDSDTSHWEEGGTNYDRDQLPYLKSDYGALVESARQDAGLTLEELAEEIGVEEATILAVEQGRAARENVPGSVIREIEATLGIELAE